jgi:starch-binding outer membrane protein, SusD/RagB family
VVDNLNSNYLMADAKTAYSIGSEERVRPNKWAAIALLARAYLYNNDYVNAEQQASLIINNSMYDTVPLNQVFSKNSKEAIWQLQPVNNGWNTEDARKFKLPASGPNTSSFPVYLSAFLMNSFENGDKRRIIGNWVNSTTVGATTYYYPYKYKSATSGAPVTEYSMMLRLAEQYLIRAEARAQQNKIAEGQADLNVIRKRAGLANTTADDKASLLTAILHERQVEFFTELGHRWLDLKRTDNIDQVMSLVTPIKGGTWSTNWQWYPIPAYEIRHNSNILQNSGY